MLEFALPSPNIGAKGYHLRRLCAAVISYIECNARNYTSGNHPEASTLKAFFDACSAALNDYVQLVPVPTFSPTAKTYSIAAGATVGPTLTKGGSDKDAVYTSSDPTKATVNASTGFVTGVAVGTSTITATIPAGAGYEAVTKTYVATVTA